MPRAEAPALQATAALVFLASAAGTIVWCGSMSAMPGMEMPGGWTMSMAWMRMPGQTWVQSGATFIGMWSLMMLAMMLPAAMPLFRRYRRAMRHAPRRDALTAAVAASYFAVWSLVGVAVFPAGVAFAELAMTLPALSRLTPYLAATVVVLAGALQFTAWKARRLECCAGGSDSRIRPGFAAAWRHGVQLGLRCNYCCASLTAILLVIGVMDLRAMAVVMTAISAERLLPASRFWARVFGALAMVAGSVMWVLA